MWSASRSRHTGCLVLAAVLAAALPAQTAESSRAVELLEQEEGVVQASLVKLESWCAKEVGSQKKQQGELLRLKAELASDADSAEAESELAAPSSPKLPTQAASSLLSTGSKAKGAFHDLDLQVKCLQDAEKELKTQSEGSFWFFRSPVEKGLMALQKVLGSLEADRSKEQHELTNVQHTPEPDMHEDEADIPTSQLSKDSARQAKKLAAARGQQVLDAALGKGQEALSEAASVCEVGRAVLGRVEQQSRPLREHAIELIGRVEGSLGLAAATAVASASNTSAGPKLNQDDLVRELLRQLQQQQALQQQQLQQQQLQQQQPIMSPRSDLQELLQELRLQRSPQRSDVQELLQELRLQLSPQVQAPQYVMQPQQQFLQPQQQQSQQVQQVQVQQPFLQPQPQQLEPQQASLQMQPQQMQPQWQAQLQQPQQAPLQIQPQPQQALQQQFERPALSMTDSPQSSSSSSSSVQQQVQPQQSLLPAPPRTQLQPQQTQPQKQQLLQMQQNALSESLADSSPSSLFSETSTAAELSLPSPAPPPLHAPNHLKMLSGAKAKSLADETQEMLKAEEAVQAKTAEKQPPSDSEAEVQPHVQEADKKTKADDAESGSPAAEDKAVVPPSSLPASLRGGWQAVLAKKRTQNKAKTKPSTQVSAIMQLMQTPKTYTAWQPDAAASDAKLAATAKSELLAAEKSFDSDDDDADGKSSGIAKGGGGRSLLQTDGGLGISQLEDELGGSDPLAFFQLSQLSSSAYTPRLFGAKDEFGAEVSKAILESFAHHLGSQSLSELAGASLGLEGLEHIAEQQSLSFDEAGHKRDREVEKRCRAAQEQHLKSIQLAIAEKERASAAKAEARAEVAVLDREMAARERLVKLFGRGSKDLLALKAELSQEVTLAGELIRQAEQEADKLPTGAAPAYMAELQSTLNRLESTGISWQTELEDAITGAVARRAEAEYADEKALDELRKRVRDLQHKAKEPFKKKVKNDDAAAGMREVCDSTMADIEARRAKRDGERLAVSSALAVLREMSRQ